MAASYLKCRISTNRRREISDMEDIPRIPVMEDINFQQILVNTEEKQVKVYGRNYEKSLLILEGEVLFNRARKLWKHMENMIVNERPIPPKLFLDTKEIVYLLLYTAQNISDLKHSSTWDFQKNIYQYVQLLQDSIKTVSKMHDNVMIKFTCDAVTLKCEPICEYFHLYLSTKYIILYIDNLCREEKEDENIKNCMADLIICSKNLYTKNKDNFINIEPFLCICVKKLWLYLINYLKKSVGKFWSIFNNVICGNDDEFVIWMVYHISILYLYDDTGYLIGVSNSIEDNYELIITCLQSITTSGLFPEGKLLDLLKVIHPLLAEVWVHNPNWEHLHVLWQYFCKNLENTSIGNSRIPKSVKEILDFLERFKSNPKSLDNPYEYYLYMLSDHLKKNANHWIKMKGRIYTRLPPQRMTNLNNKAVFQISLLFITLSLDITEAVEKLYSLLESLPRDKQESELLWIIYLTLMIINVRHNHDIKKVSTVLRHQIEAVACNREKFNLLKHYVAAMDIIMNSSQNFDLGQNVLLGSWITPYMNTCTDTDLFQLLNNITSMIVQVENCGKWYEFKHSFTEYVLPALKRISFSNSALPEVGELVGKICLNTQEITRATMQEFCKTSINIRVTHRFLVTILGNNSYINFSTSEENLLISSWFRICILSADTSHQDLSGYIFNLSSIRNIVMVDNSDNDPYAAFVRALSIQMESQSHILRLRELCEICFGNVEQWLNSVLTPNTSNRQTTYLYTTTSLFFYLCSPLLYHRAKPLCLFGRLVSLLLLPPDVLLGRPPPSNILKAIEKTWHLFMKGIYKLDHSCDPVIERVIKDLVIRYIPHFNPTNSPISNILDEPKITTTVFDKISSAFLLRAARSSEENTHKALKTIENILANTNEETKLNLILERTLLGLLEVIMFNNQKVLAMDIIKSLISAGWYAQVQSKLQLAIQSVTDRHLAFNTSNYFQLIGQLSNMMPSSVRMSLPHIKNHISHVEKMRGVGFDNTLRKGLDRIENALS